MGKHDAPTNEHGQALEVEAPISVAGSDAPPTHPQPRHAYARTSHSPIRESLDPNCDSKGHLKTPSLEFVFHLINGNFV